MRQRAGEKIIFITASGYLKRGQKKINLLSIHCPGLKGFQVSAPFITPEVCVCVCVNDRMSAW